MHTFFCAHPCTPHSGAHPIIWTVSESVSKHQEFVGVSLDDVNRSWDPFLKGRWRDKVLRKVLRLCPPAGVLKLNFDGSYFHDIQNGGIGGIIQDYEGKVIRNYYGPVDSMNTHAAKVYAMLIDCRELLSLGSYNTINEGDSHSTIQWGSGKASHPWNSTDWVEEVQDIAKQLGASFHHVHREANVMANALAKEGVLRSSILFDVKCFLFLRFLFQFAFWPSFVGFFVCNLCCFLWK
eukprot:TRINITY_DN4402_c0_g1_i3.p1 TRINITY_DN4402_c0_g1~~TRINITY_DN4402_c0_g1_i3.p1  ORF type:complete len:237 (+),score=33.87 TRINITY_DN4402_c0_g1_i3:165-875(+)